MIQANELRIGNYVTVKDRTNETYFVEQISKDRAWLNFSEKMHDGKSYSWKELLDTPIDFIQPIALTEEILLKCGFETTDNWWFKLKIETEDEFYINISPKERLAHFILRHITVSEIVNLDHLHWLQNAYFFFVGKELEIKF